VLSVEKGLPALVHATAGSACTPESPDSADR
jgi:hypothetical protein